MFTTKKESHKFKAKHVKKNTNDYKKKNRSYITYIIQKKKT